MGLSFIDFEVFKEDWLCVIKRPVDKFQGAIVNNPKTLKKYVEDHPNEIYVAYNGVRYDRVIMEAILNDMNPKPVNDQIILYNKGWWEIDKDKLNNHWLTFYDPKDLVNDRGGLKFLEGCMGDNIVESGVDFNIDRKLTDQEIKDTIRYCSNDVDALIKVFSERLDDFNTRVDLVKMIGGKNMYDLCRSKTVLASKLLAAVKKPHNDQFNITLPETLDLGKYKEAGEFFLDRKNHCYATEVEGKKTAKKTQLELNVAGVPHTIGYGGIHAGIKKYHGTGFYVMADVASMYPSLMVEYDLCSRNIPDKKLFAKIKEERMRLKKLGDQKQGTYKLVINSVYGALKDKHNNLYDPLKSNLVCIYGQLLLIDLIDKLEDIGQLIQSNTDGILFKINQSDFKEFKKRCESWSKRVRLDLDYDIYTEIYQKDVNNYLAIKEDGSVKCKGKMLATPSTLKYDCAILVTALREYMINKTPIEETINNTNDLLEFQKIVCRSSKYKALYLGDKQLDEKVIRVFAWKDGERVGKVHMTKDTIDKVGDTPEKATVYNGNVKGKKCPEKLDKQYYIDVVKERLSMFLGDTEKKGDDQDVQ